MKSNNIILLGGTGFVGRKLVSAILTQGHSVTVISRSTRFNPFPAAVKYYPCSLEHKHTLSQILPDADLVIHLASASTPSTSTLDPAFETLHNLMPTSRFLESFAEYSTANLIYLSSGGAIYGNNPNQTVDEQQPPRPLSYYGAGKAAIEALMHAFSHQTDRKVTILRPSNFYGPGQPERAGFGIIPALMSRAIHNKSIEIWGDGNTVRDYLHIDDFTQLIKTLISQNDTKSGCYIYNVGTGIGTSVNQICEYIEKLAGRPLHKTFQPIRKVDVQRIVLNCDLITSQSHWTPKISLEHGLKETWQYYHNQQNQSE